MDLLESAPHLPPPSALETLYDVARTLSSTLEFEAALEKIMTLSMSTIGSETASVMLADETNGWLVLVCSHGLPKEVRPGEQVAAGGGVAEWVYHNNEPVLLNGSPADDPRFRVHGERGHIVSALSVPVVGKNAPIGVLSLNNSTRGKAFTQEDLDLLTAIGTQAGIVVENARLHRQVTESNGTLTRTVDRLRHLKACLTQMTSTSLQRSLKILLDSTAEGTGAAGGVLTVLDEGDTVHRIEVGGGDESAHAFGEGRQSLELTLGLSSLLPGALESSTHCIIRVLSAADKAIGLLKLIAHSDGPGFTDDDREFVDALVEHASIVMYNSMLYQEAEAGRAALQQAYADLQEKQDQLIQSERLAAVGQLAAKVCHQINNPLTAISGSAQLMNRRLRKSEVEIAGSDYLQKYLETILFETERCSRITGGLLKLTRESELSYVESDLHHLLTSALDQTEVRYRGRLETAADFDFDMPPVVADPQQLGQVFASLFSNAAEAMPDGGRLTVRTRHLPGQGDETGYVHIEVTDTGTGIPQKDLDRIFEPFFTTRNDGVGLGLTISRGIVERHRGLLRLESEVGIGTAAILLLPVNARTAPRKPTALYLLLEETLSGGMS